MSLGAQQTARLPRCSCAESPGHCPWRCHGAWEPVTRFLGQGLSHMHMCSLSPSLATCLHSHPHSHSLTPSHPPMCWAKRTASSGYSVIEGPGSQDAAGADLLCCPTPLPFRFPPGPGYVGGESTREVGVASPGNHVWPLSSAVAQVPRRAG